MTGSQRLLAITAASAAEKPENDVDVTANSEEDEAVKAASAPQVRPALENEIFDVRE